MPTNPENTRDKRPYEQPPRTVNPETVRKLGETAIRGAQKEKKGK